MQSRRRFFVAAAALAAGVLAAPGQVFAGLFRRRQCCPGYPAPEIGINMPSDMATGVPRTFTARGYYSLGSYPPLNPARVKCWLVPPGTTVNPATIPTFAVSSNVWSCQFTNAPVTDPSDQWTELHAELYDSTGTVYLAADMQLIRIP